MSGAIKNAGELRAFLIDVMEEVRAGTCDPLKADRIAKLAAQVNESFYSEAQLSLTAFKIGGKVIGIGEVEIGDRANQPNQAIEHKPAQIVVETPISTPVSGFTYCGQCERRVKPAEAEACKSPFCKVRSQ